MKLYDHEIPTRVLAVYKARMRLHGALRHGYLRKVPTSKVTSYKRHGGI